MLFEFDIFIAGISWVFGTTYAFCFENGFWHLW